MKNRGFTEAREQLPQLRCRPVAERLFLSLPLTGEADMPKNILIFSDGTGQAGGLRPDENRSNIYKLYRATRCAPDTAIDPQEQLAFYDAGLGSRPPGGALFVTRAYRWLHNVASQATGLGITTNIIDCYAAIIRMWEPGDRIFLFGFSRGAYTARCLAAVLGQCGVPTTMADGTPLRRDVGTTTRIAREAVKKVYQHVSSPKDTDYLPQREALAKRFRQRYGSEAGGASNAVPFFIGVFDTVASLGSYALSAAVVGVSAVLIIALSYLQSFLLFPFVPTLLGTAVVAVTVAGVAYAATHLKCAVGLPGYSFWQTLHLASPKMKFYDLHLNNAVWYARHAMSIDESRADFARVPWGGSHNKGPQRPDRIPGLAAAGLVRRKPLGHRWQLPRERGTSVGHLVGVDGAGSQEPPRRQVPRRLRHQSGRSIHDAASGPARPTA